MDRRDTHERLMDDASWALWGDATAYERALFAEMWHGNQGQPETRDFSYRALRQWAITRLYVQGMYEPSRHLQMCLLTEETTRD